MKPSRKKTQLRSAMKLKRIKDFCANHPKWIALFIGVIFIFSNLVISYNTRKDGKRYVFWSDALEYYVYLPSTLIHHNLNVNTHGGYGPTTGKPVIKYTSGVAMLEMPFFLLAHTEAMLTKEKGDEFSETYEFCITMGTITYVFLGLLMLFYVLRRYVKPKSAFLSLIVIYFGTNLYYYSIGESGMSHAYSFFTISWFIWALHHFLDKPNWKNSLQMGIAIGLSILIRPTNILIALTPFIFLINDRKAFAHRLIWLIKQPYTYLSVFFAFTVILPQLIYWKIQTNSFIYYSYPGETFTFLTSPHLGDVLFGNVAGLFTYSPLLLLFIPGLFFLYKQHHRYTSMGIILIFSTITYLNASWWIPTFDCSFGHRAFIEYFPLLTIPIAFSFERLFLRWKAYLISAAIVILIFTNVRMSYLYKKQPCWNSDWGINWTWKNVAYVLRVVFFIDNRPTYHFRVIDKQD